MKTDLKRGLTEEEAEKRLQEGHNEVQQVKETHWALLFLSQMSDPFSLLVWVTVVLAFIGYIILKDSNQLVLAILLIITLISGACISYGFVDFNILVSPSLMALVNLGKNSLKSLIYCELERTNP